MEFALSLTKEGAILESTYQYSLALHKYEGAMLIVDEL
jgi:hypothetical protein